MMIPIHKLLSRIHWDKSFGKGQFEIGYYDRVEDTIIRVPLREILFEPGDRSSFKIVDADGEVHSVPLHRIKEVYRDGELIWHRKH